MEFELDIPNKVLFENGVTYNFELGTIVQNGNRMGMDVGIGIPVCFYDNDIEMFNLKPKDKCLYISKPFKIDEIVVVNP